jgi:hypothetical protein
MLKNKHMRLDQEKIEKAKRILQANTDTEAIERALDKLIQEEEERLRKRRIMKKIIDLRNSLGAIKDDPAEWVGAGRDERISI